jgi:hypothetical protein
MEAGIRGAERRVNYALQRSRTENLRTYGWAGEKPGLADKINASMQTILFDWTCRYGLEPGRSLKLIAVLWLLCTILYAAATFKRPHYIENHIDWKTNAPADTSQSAIWAVPLEKRVSSGSSEPVLVHVDLEKDGWLKSLRQALATGNTFSLISAFRVGFKDVDIGRWLELIRGEESTLRGTGWVRTLSGIQSMLSFYLLALWMLTTMFSPFG